VTRWIGKLWLALFGWRAESEEPVRAKMVFIAAPHTSNWDLPFMLAVAWTLGIAPRWMGKASIFRAPFGGLMRALGGVPVDRSAPQGLVGQMKDAFAGASTFALVIPPEGTRGRTEHWKSGFYRIAEAAQVPIACGFLDYGRKRGGVGPVLMPSGDPAADMARIAEFYADVTAKFPADFGPVQLAEAGRERER